MLDDTQGSHPYEIQIYTDANWAGCGLPRKSTSGVLVHLLGVTVAFSSKTQAIHALSSAESELYAMCSGAADGLHLRAFLFESQLASRVSLLLYTDSSSGKSSASPYGASRRTRHVQFRFLFVQDLVQNGTIQLRKINGELNPADVFTKFAKA